MKSSNHSFMKRLLAEVGILKPKTIDPVAVELDSEDMQEYEDIEALDRDITELRKAYLRIEGELRAKTNYLEGLKDMWEQRLKNKYRLAPERVYIDKLYGCMRIKKEHYDTK